MAVESATIRLERVSKRYGRQWVIRELDATFAGAEPIGVRGRNGAGKSTLLRLLSAQLSPTRGSVRYTVGGRTVPPGEMYRFVSWTGPYFEVVEELSLLEFLTFHFRMKPARANLDPREMLERTELLSFADRTLTDCSSGMRQRILLATALYAATPIMLLDEPTVTFDAAAVAWFHRELREFGRDRLTVIASNDAADLRGCASVIDL